MLSKKIFLQILLFFVVNTALLAQTIVSNLNVINSTCNNSDGSASASASGGTGPYSYEWRVGYTGPVFSTATSITDLAPEFYSVTITDANNVSKTDSFSIVFPITGYVIGRSFATCPQKNGSASVEILQGGTPPFTYLWSNGSTNKKPTNLEGNITYYVSGSDANGCDVHFTNSINSTTSTTGSVTIVMNNNISATFVTTSENCPTTKGSAKANPNGGIGPYTYFWNTFPVQTTRTATNLSAGSYSVKITDANGCNNTEYVEINYITGTLLATGSITNDACSQSQGSISLNISGGNPPYNILWDDGSSSVSKSGLIIGNYTVFISDQNNCEITKKFFVDDISPVSVIVSTTSADCNNANGAVIANATGGTLPYTYQWNNGATSSSINNLPSDYYSVLVKDANGCKDTYYGFVKMDNSCRAYISGIIFQDNNGNCMLDAGEYQIQNSMIRNSALAITNDLYQEYDISDSGGEYSLWYMEADQYTLSNYDYIRTSPCLTNGLKNINIPMSGVNYYNIDFAKYPNSLYEDVEIIRAGALLSEPRPGFDYSYNINFDNIGTLPTNGYIEVVYGEFESFVSSIPEADYYNPATKTLRFNFASLMLGEIRNIQLTFNINLSATIGSTYYHEVTAFINGPSDPTPQNNHVITYFKVVGSYDPNDLSVVPKDYLDITADTVLSYTIRFQNTGTYPAELVVIRDEIDENLDLSTLRATSASHRFKTRMLENRVVEFIFERINLPDSARDEKRSHGSISFNINRVKGLALGTEIKNQVGIYFDYNAPVITNTTNNIIAVVNSTLEPSSTNHGKVYPNPAKDQTEFIFEKGITSISLMNASGIEVLTQTCNNQKEIKLSLNLSRGIYFYKATTENGDSYSGKLIIE